MNEIDAPTNPPYFALTFRPNVELISLVRRFVSSFYEHALPDRDTISRVALATHELLENAVKYSIDGETSIRIELVTESDAIRIHISNRTDPSHLGALRQRFEEMTQFEDPFVYYQRMIERSAKRTDGGSGLGLARIRAEAEMSLACEIEGNNVCIVAHAPMQVKRAEGAK